MAATVRINEQNGTAPGSEFQGITTSNYGISDIPNLDPIANPITPGSNSYEKWQRWELTALGGSAAIRNLKFFASTPATNTTHNFNGHITQATYAGANHRQTTYATAATTATRTPEAVPTTAPASANVGIGGFLTGSLIAPGRSDYVVSQIRTTVTATAGATLTITFRYDEIA